MAVVYRVASMITTPRLVLRPFSIADVPTI
jgi:hypothetical protein